MKSPHRPQPCGTHPSTAVSEALPTVPGAPAAAEVSCRPDCGACCTAPSISSPIPGMPFTAGLGKPAGVACVQLTADLRCALFGLPQRPAVCASLRPTAEMCGATREHAIAWLTTLDRDTAPQPVRPRHGNDRAERALTGRSRR